MKEEIMDNRNDVEVLKRIVCRHSVRLDQLNENVVNLTACSMQKNMTISSLIGDQQKDENCKKMVTDFCRDIMKIPVEMKEIFIAHKIGKFVPGQERLMVVRCQPELKQRILQNVRALRGVKNQKGNLYYVNKQLPEALVERDHEIRVNINKIKQREEDMVGDKKTKNDVRAGTLNLNNEPVKKKVLPPSAQD